MQLQPCEHIMQLWYILARDTKTQFPVCSALQSHRPLCTSGVAEKILHGWKSWLVSMHYSRIYNIYETHNRSLWYGKFPRSYIFLTVHLLRLCSVLDVFHTCLLSHSLYWYCFASHGNPVQIESTTWWVFVFIEKSGIEFCPSGASW